MKKTQKAWAVVWGHDDFPQHTGDIVIAETDSHGPEYLTVDFPLFRRKQEAKTFLNNVGGWTIMPCEIIYQFPDKWKKS